MDDSFPEGWTKTLDDLTAELETRNAPLEEWNWARAYERSLLRAWVRFPKDGEVFEALEDMTVTYLTHWDRPCTGGGTGTIARGTRVRVEVTELDPEPLGVYAVPIEQKKIERLLVPKDERRSGGYQGYSIGIATSDLNRRFRLIA